MTVQANLPPTNTNSDGVTTTFNYGFKVTREEHLKAMYTVIATGETGDLEIDSVTGVGNDGGGTVTFATAPADGMIITVDSIAPLSQIEAFTGNKLPPATVERMGDAIAIQNQRQQSQIERSVRFPASDDQIPTLPAKAQRADKILGFSADGSDFAMVEGAAASQAYVDQAEAQADRAVAAATYPYTGGEQKTGAFMPGAGESLTLFTYNAVSDAAVTLPALAGLAAGYNIGICRTTGSGDLTISADDGALINGSSSVVLASDYLCLDLTINEAGDEWVAVDKALIGLPVGTSANNIVVLDNDGKLPAVDGANLLNIEDQLSRDMSASAMALLMAQADAAALAGSVGPFKHSNNFQSDTLPTSTGATYDAANDRYGPSTGADATTDSYSETNKDTDVAMYQGNNEEVGQALTLASAKTIKSVKFWIKRVGSLSGNNLKAEIRAASGTVGTGAVPSGAVLGTSSNVGMGTIGTSYAWVTFTFSSPVELAAGDYTVGLVWPSGGVGNSSNRIDVGSDTSSPTHSGNAFKTNSAGSGWSAAAGEDVCFDLIAAGDPEDMTLVDDTITIGASAQAVLAYFLYQPVDTVTLGTDLLFDVSIDGGSTWAAAVVGEDTFAEIGDIAGTSKKLVRALVDVSGQSGTSQTYRLRSANAKTWYYTDYVGDIAIF
ncbi:hypothetical protein [Thalassospira povalilytica]|uniref:hypothetical protein n=1 Tax=Thalassospira povalilytica TaxID=732237 RepID=UPI003AA824CA